MKILVKESVLRKMIKEALVVEFNNGNYHERRPGALGNHQGSESSLNSIPQSHEAEEIARFIKDMGIASPEKREQWKRMSPPRVPNYNYYPNKSKQYMWSHILHLKAQYGDRIKFFSYNNGEYIFYSFEGKNGYLQPGILNSEYK